MIPPVLQVVNLVLMSLVASQEIPTTTKIYDLEIPGSSPIRIIEGESLWATTTTAKPESRFEHRSFSYTTDQTASLKSPLEDNDDNVRDTSEALQKFLSKYAETVKNKKNKYTTSDYTSMENIELITKPSFVTSDDNNNNSDNSDSSEDNDNSDRSKSWDLLHFQKHNHPYDDKKGWVSMEPVPWSVSKISKWQSKHKPSTPKPWDNDYDNNDRFSNYDNNNRWPQNNKPYNSNKKPTQFYYVEDNRRPSPIITATQSKPFAIYDQKLQYPPQNHYKHDENCNHNDRKSNSHEFDDIITDGLPANFPQPYDNNANRRRGTEIYPENHPFSGEGDWVLLSTTKGYKFPQNRQRSLQITPDSIGTHRGVRLTVLPPLKNSKINMTTSHGGLLQVESTFESVEQSKNQFLKKQRMKNKKLQKVINEYQNYQRPKQTIRQIVAPATTSTKSADSTVPDTSAVLAAVGAGMIPATMAMLVPIAMSGRKKREAPTKLLEITLPRNI